jgi:hypothetical protein
MTAVTELSRSAPWFARFDRRVLRAPSSARADADAVADLAANVRAKHDQATWGWLADWCHDGLGSGRAPFLQPWAARQVAEPFTLALIANDRPGLDPKSCAALLQAFCRDIDGTERLLAMSTPWHGMAWRVGIKLQESLWWLRRSRRLPWDAGYLLDDADAMVRWPHFRPRRPTLIVSQGLDELRLRHAVQVLRARSPAYAQPVRMLVAAPAQLIGRWTANNGLGECRVRR